MANATLTTRIGISLEALFATWFVCGVSTGLHSRDFGISLLFFFWSVPFFAVGWILMGIPIIAMGDLILRIPTIILVSLEPWPEFSSYYFCLCSIWSAIG